MSEASLSGCYVAIIGPAEAEPGMTRIAEEAGKLAAEAGAVVVTGGRGGVMEAACRGAKRGGGTTLGLLPGRTRADANPFLDIAIPSGMGEMRNLLVVRSADGLIAVGKGYGTLSEIGFALREGKPVVGINSWDVKLEDPKGILQAESAREALGILSRAIGLYRSSGPKALG